MGAHDISFELDGAKPFSAVLEAFKVRRSNDAYENNRDFETVERVENHSDKVFDSFNKAHDYCLDNAKKRESVIAVKVRVADKIMRSKAEEKLLTKSQELASELQTIKAQALDAYKAKRLASKTMACDNCKSKLAASYLSELHTDCPVCGKTLTPKAYAKRIARVELRLQATNEKRYAIAEKAKTKAIAKANKSIWLVAGWGAS